MSEEQKIHYDTAKELISVIGVLMQPEDIVKQYKDAAEEMKLAGDYEDAKELEKTYLEKAAVAESEGKEMLYQKAKSRMDNAKKSVELKLALQIFERVIGYKDTDQLMKECEKQIASMKKKSVTKSWIEMLAVATIAAALIFGVIIMDDDKNHTEEQTEIAEVIETETAE